ncbi:hypothetical protein BpHYR1_001728 [Brachionus plicatilis]|uniref:Uncharacterized protein n=1 Tax=Brachionus plicatilis TaxID=10195 RepID=A0A3M7PXT1_BRAPC|nr:hypothetical protein BpHYR1_001728 [Brachionus plicatilis]
MGGQLFDWSHIQQDPKKHAFFCSYLISLFIEKLFFVYVFNLLALDRDLAYWTTLYYDYRRSFLARTTFLKLKFKQVLIKN